MTKRNYEQLLKELELNLHQEIDEDIFGDKDHIMNKFFTVRAGLMHRAYELAISAHHCANQHQIISSKILTRSLFETTSVLGFLYYKLVIFNNDQNIENFNQMIMRVMLGSKDNTSQYESFNVLTMIDKINLEFEGYRASYDQLSEYSHPNFLGTCGIFGNLEVNQPTKFSKTPINSDQYKEEIIDSICLSIDLLKYFSKEIHEIIEEAAEITNALFK